MVDSANHEAAKPNPALEPLSVSVGTRNTVGTHPLVPGTTFHGRTTFDWLEGGAFLIMRSQIDEPGIPVGSPSSAATTRPGSARCCTSTSAAPRGGR